jgi:hypothetical protein
VKRGFALIALLAAAALIVPRLPFRLHVLFPLLLLPPKLRVVAIVVALLAAFGAAWVCPRLRAARQRWTRT